MITNKIGLEAEFLVRGKDNSLVYPELHGFSTDDFIILGEFRAEPGETVGKTLSNFMGEYYKVLSVAKRNCVTIDLTGYDRISAKFHAETLRKMGCKELPLCKNIYGTDIMELTDEVITDGKIEGFKISTGLHIHFSSDEDNKVEVPISEANYVPVNLPFKIGDVPVEFSLFKKVPVESKTKSYSAHASANRITQPVLEYIVKSLDEKILPKYKLPEELKFRNPGFYELKGYGGFEYRSLPFTKDVLNDIAEIVEFSFNLLNSLDLK